MFVFSHSFLLSFVVVEILNRFSSHRALLWSFFSIINSTLQIKRSLHAYCSFILLFLQSNLFIKLMICMLKAFFDTFYHLTIALSVLEIDCVAVFHLLYLFLLICLFYLFVLLSWLSCRIEENLLFLFVCLDYILSWSVIIENFVSFMFSQNHIFFLLEFTQSRDDSRACLFHSATIYGWVQRSIEFISGHLLNKIITT